MQFESVRAKSQNYRYVTQIACNGAARGSGARKAGIAAGCEPSAERPAVGAVDALLHVGANMFKPSPFEAGNAGSAASFCELTC